MSSIEVVLAFMDRINDHAVEKLLALMTEDHLFVDSLGNSTRGRDKMKTAWQGYFFLCPDYRVEHVEAISSGEHVAIFGSAGGTIAADGLLPPENKWQIPAAWHAVMRDGLLKEWRVYADNKPVYDILSKIKPNPPK